MIHNIKEAEAWFLSHSSGSVTCRNGTMEMECSTFPEAQAFYRDLYDKDGSPNVLRFEKSGSLLFLEILNTKDLTKKVIVVDRITLMELLK